MFWENKRAVEGVKFIWKTYLVDYKLKTRIVGCAIQIKCEVVDLLPFGFT